MSYTLFFKCDSRCACRMTPNIASRESLNPDGLSTLNNFPVVCSGCDVEIVIAA